jgi:bifunctional non-homologous end joining protein LigD
MITHPEKLLFPADGLTKADLAAYYELVAPVMLPHLRGRPVTMERYPAGIDGKRFFHKSVTRGFPDWLVRVEVPKHGGTVWHPLVDDVRTLLWMANQNCITPHVWNRRVPHLQHPDWCVFDLDPEGEGAAGEAAALRDATLALRELLAEHGLRSWVKTSGSKGFHVIVPLDGSAGVGDVAGFAHRPGAELVRRDPDRLTQAFAKAERGGRIYVDTGRNDYSATVAAAYAVRARPGAPVSAPCTWDEVASGEVLPQTITLRTMAARLAALGDVWAELPAYRATLPR